jgi:hypothetical protein
MSGIAEVKAAGGHFGRNGLDGAKRHTAERASCFFDHSHCKTGRIGRNEILDELTVSSGDDKLCEAAHDLCGIEANLARVNREISHEARQPYGSFCCRMPRPSNLKALSASA